MIRIILLGRNRGQGREQDCSLKEHDKSLREVKGAGLFSWGEAGEKEDISYLVECEEIFYP